MNELAARYGRLIPLRFVDRRRFPSGKSHPYWEFKCDCGNTLIASLPLVKSGHTKSCGCFQKEVRSQAHTKHGACKNGTLEPIYKVWCGMIQRCNDPNSNIYERYGARGIRVKWESFEQFRQDMLSSYQRGLQIERINNDGDYEPGNCRWATAKEQARNRRSNIVLTFNGQRMCIADWADTLGFRRTTLEHRYHRGWSTEQILTTPTK